MENITADHLAHLAHRYIEAFSESEAYYEDLDTDVHEYFQEARDDYYEALGWVLENGIYVSEF